MSEYSGRESPFMFSLHPAASHRTVGNKLPPSRKTSHEGQRASLWPSHSVSGIFTSFRCTVKLSPHLHCRDSIGCKMLTNGPMAPCHTHTLPHPPSPQLRRRLQSWRSLRGYNKRKAMLVVVSRGPPHVHRYSEATQQAPWWAADADKVWKLCCVKQTNKNYKAE